jgi:hypothetical protein
MDQARSDSSTIRYRSNVAHSTSAAIAIEPAKVNRSGAAKSERAIDSAVLAHLRARRALGHTTVNSGDVARALGLSPGEVLRSLGRLAPKGVKAAR